MERIGSRAKVMHGNALQTSGGLRKTDLKYNKWGKIVSKKASRSAKRTKNLGKHLKGGLFTSRRTCKKVDKLIKNNSYGGREFWKLYKECCEIHKSKADVNFCFGMSLFNKMNPNFRDKLNDQILSILRKDPNVNWMGLPKNIQYKIFNPIDRKKQYIHEGYYLFNHVFKINDGIVYIRPKYSSLYYNLFHERREKLELQTKTYLRLGDFIAIEDLDKVFGLNNK